MEPKTNKAGTFRAAGVFSSVMRLGPSLVDVEPNQPTFLSLEVLAAGLVMLVFQESDVFCRALIPKRSVWDRGHKRALASSSDGSLLTLQPPDHAGIYPKRP